MNQKPTYLFQWDQLFSSGLFLLSLKRKVLNHQYSKMQNSWNICYTLNINSKSYNNKNLRKIILISWYLNWVCVFSFYLINILLFLDIKKKKMKYHFSFFFLNILMSLLRVQIVWIVTKGSLMWFFFVFVLVLNIYL